MLLTNSITNMVSYLEILNKELGFEGLTYSAHVLNLLVKDLVITDIIK